ncbi:Putative nuclease [Frankliniella fusca]|uniref:Nuclease n=1 Tax=Frankliniella fusca TaxID=407009 RepID=A0AAE1HZT1_9NEOP|nr:Putative nuclease [Frankliniella fusca]
MLEVDRSFLATGSYQKFSGALFTIPQPTANGIIRETCEALWDELREEVFPPMTEESMARTMDGFWERWDFPNMIGALDGKHVNMQNQPNAREGEWLNYKGDFSMVLLGMCDANYKFVYVSIGGRGRRNDAGLWKECALYAALRDGTLPLPPPRQLPGGRVVTPPTIVGDGAFPLGPNLMTPFRQPQIVAGAQADLHRLRGEREVHHQGLRGAAQPPDPEPGERATAKEADDVITLAEELYEWEEEEICGGCNHIPQGFHGEKHVTADGAVSK